MTPQDLANKLLAFYDNKPERWTQGAHARSPLGHKVVPKSSDGVCWCLAGAVYKLDLGDRYDEFANAFFDGSLVLFNDSCADFDEFRTKLEKVANS